MVIHIVKPGDTPYSIARQYGVSPDMLINDNELYTQPHLVVGQAIVVQFPEETHVVRPGETLLSIAESYGVSVNQLFRNNPVLNGRPQIVAGQTLVITYDRQIEGTMQV
ncbi:MAG: LysM peptidoglycan-binding domain-containing protein, partial [Clostridiales bacterium]|nr:LysM peptidoglycan-binding domain-containing protein [Clostridiales bacterium]